MLRRALLVALVLAGCTGGDAVPDDGFWPFTPGRREAAAPSGDPIKIGAVFSTTGGIKWLDTPGLQGFRLAAEEINGTGGVLGRPIEVVHVDGRTHPLTIAEAVEKMIGRDVVALGGLLEPTFGLAPLRGAVRLPNGGLISFDHSSTVGAVYPSSSRAGIPLVTAGTTNLPLQGASGIHPLSAGFDRLMRAAVDHAYDALGARTAAVIADDGTRVTNAMTATFQQWWRARGGSILDVVIYPSGSARHLDEQLAAIRGLDAPPEVIFLAVLPNEIGILMEEIRQAGLDMPVVTGAAYDSPYIVAFAQENADGLWFTADASLLDPDPRVTSFVARFEQRYGHPPPHLGALQGYDAMRMIAAAIERAGSADAAAIERALSAIEGFPILGGTLSYSRGSRGPQRPVAIMAARDGTLRFVARA